MRVAIKAYENTYGGLHGMEEKAVITVDSVEEAEDIAMEMSYNVMDSYAEISDYFETMAEGEGLEPNSEEWNVFIDECKAESVLYDIHPITVKTEKTDEELSEEYFRRPDEFIKEYCKCGAFYQINS